MDGRTRDSAVRPSGISTMPPRANLDTVWRRLLAHHQQLERELERAYRRLGLVNESDWERARAAAARSPQRVNALAQQLAGIQGEGHASWEALRRIDFSTLAGRAGSTLLRG